MKKYMAIKRENGTVFLQRLEPETASEPPLSEYDLLVIELVRKLEKLETLVQQRFNEIETSPNRKRCV
jgi:hypothetical protein